MPVTIFVACAYPSRLGEEKCTYGPSYWCENYKQAVECQAIEHCREYVWKAKGVCILKEFVIRIKISQGRIVVNILFQSHMGRVATHGV
jgi:hypothetical protein